MSNLRVGVSASMLFLLTVSLSAMAPSLACGDTSRMLTGELVPTNASRNQFRIVGHAGSFTAPAGTSVDALDGKPVQVELSQDGRVIRITEQPIQINHITHSEEVVSGQLVVRDPVARTFSFASADRIYVAPDGIDIRPYGGHMVEVRLNEEGQVTDMRFATHSFNAPAADAPLSQPARSCLVGDASVADGSSVCRAGTTFRCRDGNWVNLGTACS